MITFPHCSLARNSRDVTMKHVHSEKRSYVNRRVVAVFKVAVFHIGGRDCLKHYAEKCPRENDCTLHKRLSWAWYKPAETPLAPAIL